MTRAPLLQERGWGEVERGNTAFGWSGIRMEPPESATIAADEIDPLAACPPAGPPRLRRRWSASRLRLARRPPGAFLPAQRRDDRGGLPRSRLRRHLLPQRERDVPRRQHHEGAGDDGALSGGRRRRAAAERADRGAQPVPEHRRRLALRAGSQGGW